MLMTDIQQLLISQWEGWIQDFRKGDVGLGVCALTEPGRGRFPPRKILMEKSFIFSDEHPKETEEVWATLCSCWANNLKVIIRYLIIISGMAPQELLPYAKRVVVYLARARPERLLDEMMTELQTVETLNCLIERTETPPFYRLTSMRKASSHSDGPGGVAGQTDQGSRSELGVEKGTIHTKRHSGEDPGKTGTSKSDSALRALAAGYAPPRTEKTRTASGPPILSDDMSTTSTTEPELPVVEDEYCLRSSMVDKFDIPQPHPLPMPEYGGYFAPLTEPPALVLLRVQRGGDAANRRSSGWRGLGLVHSCTSYAAHLVLGHGPQPSLGSRTLQATSPQPLGGTGMDLDWSIHVPLMLHILFLGMDHNRPLVHEHCKQLLLNLLVVLAEHNDHLTVAHILLNSKTAQLGLGLPAPALPVLPHVFTGKASYCVSKIKDKK
uniref:Cell morphogenesis central region domain-containing protein n=1 Tax=Timema cristinae TaxID=61476 RepID=A0A7R9CD50_TIMCR|nr:unnamed protein product [Timema cristinae]